MYMKIQQLGEEARGRRWPQDQFKHMKIRKLQKHRGATMEKRGGLQRTLNVDEKTAA